MRREAGADNGGRTRDTKLGKLVLYQLSYVRPIMTSGEDMSHTSFHLQDKLPRQIISLFKQILFKCQVLNL